MLRNPSLAAPLAVILIPVPPARAPAPATPSPAPRLFGAAGPPTKEVHRSLSERSQSPFRLGTAALLEEGAEERATPSAPSSRREWPRGDPARCPNILGRRNMNLRTLEYSMIKLLSLFKVFIPQIYTQIYTDSQAA